MSEAAKTIPEPNSERISERIPEIILDSAFLWAVRLNSGTVTDKQQQAFQHWLAENPLHKLAWQQVQLLENEFTPLKVHGKKSRMVLESRELKQNKNWLGLSSTLSVLGLLMASYFYTATQGYWSEYSTIFGGPKWVNLEPATQLWINGGTRLHIERVGSKNRIKLLAGEILLDTSEVDPAHKPTVETTLGSFTPVGTRFNIKVDATASQLAVIKGQVKASSIANPSERIVKAGNYWRLTESGGKVGTANGIRPGSWATGIVEANNASLAAVIEQLSRQHNGLIHYADEVVDYKVTGVFHLQATDTALKALAGSLPIKIDYYSDYFIMISAKK